MRRFGEIADTDFALARLQRIRVYRAKRQGVDVVSAHGRSQHFNGKERTGASKEEMASAQESTDGNDAAQGDYERNVSKTGDGDSA